MRMLWQDSDERRRLTHKQQAIMNKPTQTPAPKCVSTLELIVHVYHDKEDGSDISVDEIVEQLKQAIEDIKEAGTHRAWMDIIYTEER